MPGSVTSQPLMLQLPRSPWRGGRVPPLVSLAVSGISSLCTTSPLRRSTTSTRASTTATASPEASSRPGRRRLPSATSMIHAPARGSAGADLAARLEAPAGRHPEQPLPRPAAERDVHGPAARQRRLGRSRRRAGWPWPPRPPWPSTRSGATAALASSGMPARRADCGAGEMSTETACAVTVARTVGSRRGEELHVVAVVRRCVTPAARPRRPGRRRPSRARCGTPGRARPAPAGGPPRRPAGRPQGVLTQVGDGLCAP